MPLGSRSVISILSSSATKATLSNQCLVCECHYVHAYNQTLSLNATAFTLINQYYEFERHWVHTRQSVF
jgi:hypothetical protein